MDLYGKLNNPIKMKEYIGANTTTAKTNVDANTNTISVDVKKVPQPLIINFEGTDKDTQYDGSKEVTINVTTTESIDEMKEVIDKAFEDVDTEISNVAADLNGKISTNSNNIETLQANLESEVSDREDADNSLLAEINTKQDKLTAGSNIRLVGNTISSFVPQPLVEQISRNSNDIRELSPKVEQLETDLPLLEDRVIDIEELIPEGTTYENSLTNKEFVNSSISTNTANFKGTYESITDLEIHATNITNNDYAFVTNNRENPLNFNNIAELNAYDKTLLTNWDYAWITDGSVFDLYRFDIVNQTWTEVASNISDKTSVTLNSAFNRYKAVINGGTVTWTYEYTLNNSSFTAQQWAAINSGITSQAVSQIETNRVNVTNLQVNKQDKLTAGSNIQITTENSETIISATDTKYTAGANITIDANNQISAVDTTYTAGTNVQINNGVISATNTTYSAGTGLSLSGTQFNMTGNLPFLTTAPTANNTGGVKIVILNYEPSTKYDGYIYFITEN